MPTTRLSSDMRARIVKAALIHAFRPAVDALRERRAGLALSVYRDVFPENVQLRMNTLPRGWLPKVDRITAQMGPVVASLRFDGSFAFSNRTARLYGLESKTGHTVERLMPSDKTGGVCAVYDIGHAFHQEHDAIEREALALAEKVERTEATTRATIDKFQNIDRLLEAWPEIRPFTEGLAAKPRQTALAIPVATLNEALDLPVGGEART